MQFFSAAEGSTKKAKNMKCAKVNFMMNVLVWANNKWMQGYKIKINEKSWNSSFHHDALQPLDNHDIPVAAT